MRIFLVGLLLVLASCSNGASTVSELDRWQATADRVTITRDKWGIPHVYGPTDADAVFGMMVAQAEDDFNRVEMNFLTAMGRAAEAEGEAKLYQDLRMRMFIDPDVMRSEYDASPEWLKKLMNAWADGLNYYLHTHPEVQPKVLTRFEPWMALTFSEGSIGGDIERVNLRDLEAFYGGAPAEQLASKKELMPLEPTGSNGFAIAPSNSATGNALLLINPHTSFYFRAEMHVRSDEGLNAYGAVTWGQFFIYQGFNENTGWMHTSSGADTIDWYNETIIKKDDGIYYQYGGEQRQLKESDITLSYKTDNGAVEKTFRVYHSHHGPIIAGEGGTWQSIQLMNRPQDALMQSYLRTKSTDYASFLETMRLHTNSSNNTVYADSGGNIAYFHANHIPVRDTSFDWSKPVDGSNPATEWGRLHTVEETVGILNPATGWLQNTNNTPFSVIGEASPKAEDFPAYMATFPENYRGINAVRVLKDKKDFTLQTLIDAAYDPYLAAFDVLLPILFADYDALNGDDSRTSGISEQIAMLRDWDKNAGVDSVETTLATVWAERVWRSAFDDRTGVASFRARGISYDQYIAEVADARGLPLFSEAVAKLEEDFGTWQLPFGEINRYQRLTGDIVQPFDDEQPSTAVKFPSARWGSLAAYGQRTFNGTKKTYGTRGNSFVAVVEFGEKVQALAITAGGQSGDPSSPHFDDQIELYARGEFRPVYFYPEDIEAVAEETYKPGARQ
ncbi:MAG: penicillin acylase family protein [Kordiimonadaceae bacterium]|nr:penicillin acylase family protein [Kordiimonadaceae bacterium]MBO6568274.1 penicillin acylase family protein [Kordiimonadaceae bacterium]MBO6963996.1 penicillin acylase family protein [Kordiimonadaceae bacterium]